MTDPCCAQCGRPVEQRRDQRWMHRIPRPADPVSRVIDPVASADYERSRYSVGALVLKMELPLILIFRGLWQTWTSIETALIFCASFYVIPVVSYRLGWRPRPGSRSRLDHWQANSGLIGVILNHAVILANGGVMPVSPEQAEKSISIWVRSSELANCNLCFLSDVLPLGLSIGDVLILSSLLMAGALWLTRKFSIPASRAIESVASAEYGRELGMWTLRTGTHSAEPDITFLTVRGCGCVDGCSRCSGTGHLP